MSNKEIQINYLILNFFNNPQGGNVRQLASANPDVDRQELKRYTNSLVDAGSLFQSGRNLGAVYRITDKGKNDIRFWEKNYPNIVRQVNV